MSDAPSNTCVICGATEPLGLSVCPACGGTAQAVGDTFVFVKTHEAGRDRRRVDEALAPLLSGRSHDEERELVVAGHRPLIRVPRASADTVVRELALRYVPAVARSVRSTWVSAPLPFYGLLGAMVLVGAWAGRAAEPLLLWTSPLMALALLLAAQARLRVPAIVVPHRRVVFSAPVEKAVVTTLARLPAGEARDLLARLVRSAEPVHRTLREVRAAGVRPADVEQLLTHASRAALDLADLQEGLAALESEPGMERVQALHDGLIARFRQGIRVLHQLHAETVDADPARAELAELVEALDTEAETYASAKHEVRSLLASA
jgi:hypothetical protein